GADGAEDDGAWHEAAAGFRGLDSRLALADTIDGVDFVDDSLSTNVLPTLAALDAFAGRRVALIAGGAAGDIAYAPLAEGMQRRPEPTLVLTVYQTGPRIQAAIGSAPSPHVAARPAADLLDAVRQAWAWARPDGVVLLSPA